jgi:hypothetical protein
MTIVTVLVARAEFPTRKAWALRNPKPSKAFGLLSKTYWLHMAAADFVLISYHFGKPNRYQWTSFPYSTLRRWRWGPSAPSRLESGLTSVGRPDRCCVAVKG